MPTLGRTSVERQYVRQSENKQIYNQRSVTKLPDGSIKYGPWHEVKVKGK